MKRIFTFLLIVVAFTDVKSQNNPSPFIGTNLTRGTHLRVLKLAVSCNGEYTQSVGGVANANANIQAWLPIINEIYGREYSVRFELIPNNDLLIFANLNTDPWPTLPEGAAGCTGTAPIRDNQARVIDSIIGSANYDFSHVITGGVNGGCAGSFKRGHSGDFDIGVTRHEMGHQFQQSHTIANSGNNNYEPQNGGWSIQGGNIHPYAHSKTFHDLALHLLNTEPNTGTKVVTNNTIPMADAGADVAIPINTPYVLTAIASDPDVGDTLSYAWDFLDAGIAQSIPIPDDTQGPLFMRLAPSRSSSRMIPKLSDVIANNKVNAQEQLPTQARDMNIRLTVNDNHKITLNGAEVHASGINSDDIKITVVNTGTPFQVTSPNTIANYTGGSSQTVTWDVSGTHLAPINTANVKISMSTNGGLDFPIVLVNSTTNDGSATVVLPNINTTQARIKVEAIGNIYFDISDTDFTLIQNPALPGINVLLTGANTLVSENGQTDTYSVGLLTGPSSPVTVALTTDEQVEISLDGINFQSTQNLVFNNTTPQTITVRGTYDTAIEGPHIGDINHIVSTTGDNVNYPVGLLGEHVSVTITDAQVGPVIGIDFDAPSSTNSPNHWVRFNTFIGQSATNIPLDDGTPTAVDVSINASLCGFGACTFGDNPSGNYPNHIQSLNGPLDGSAIARDSAQVVWSDLKPNTLYRIFVFANTSLSQSMKLMGNGLDNPAPFLQTTNGGLSINGLQSTTMPLASFGKEVTSTGDGKVMFSISNPGNEVLMNGIAIQEVMGNPNVPNCVNYPAITFPNGGETIIGATAQNVTWTLPTCMGSAANVRILLSTDGGTTFPTVLANSTANDGVHNLTFPNINATQAVLKVESIGDSIFDISDQVFTINLDPNGPLINVTHSGSNTLVNESGQSDTFHLSLNTKPLGAVTIIINADAQTEVSLDGIHFGASQSIIISDSLTKTITVRGRGDLVAEGAHTGLIEHVISASNDAINYPVGSMGPSLLVNISDAQIAPVVGVDFDVSNSPISPNHWGHIADIRNGSLTNISLDDGTPTSIDLTSTADNCGIGGCSFGSGGFTVPQHIQSLSDMSGLGYARGTVNFTWSGLKGTSSYRVFLFGINMFSSINQNVSIQGNGVATTFNQTADRNVLLINEQMSTTQPLFSFGKEITSSATGTITITVTPNSGSTEMSFAGLAIQEVLVPLSSSCPSNHTLSGSIMMNQKYETDGTINSSQIISGMGTVVDYDARTSIIMNPNFEVVLGAQFRAIIDGCGNMLRGDNSSMIPHKKALADPLFHSEQH